MAFVRKEVAETIFRFRDALAGVAISLFGAYWAVSKFGFLSIVGTSLVVAGALLVFAGIQRGRFRNSAGGAGVVHVDEGQVTYFGPENGGSVIIADLHRVDLRPSNRAKTEWVFYDPGTEPLHIPTNAEGAESLFDVFSNLEGLQMETMLSTLKSRQKKQVVIWQAKRAVLH